MTTLNKSTSTRLDALAQVLVGTFAAMAGLLTLVGANSDRVWVWLDQDGKQAWLVGAGLLAVAAIGLALLALVSPGNTMTVLLLGLASLFYVSALIAALLGASRAANAAGRPSFTAVDVRETTGGGRELTFSVQADSVDLDQLVKVEVIAGGRGNSVLNTVLRPDAHGVVRLETTIPLPDSGSSVTLKANRTDDSVTQCPSPNDPQPEITGPACLTVTP